MEKWSPGAPLYPELYAIVRCQTFTSSQIRDIFSFLLIHFYHWSPSVPTENIWKLLVFWCFRGIEKDQWHEMGWTNNFSKPFKRQPHELVKHTEIICRLLPTNYLSVFDHFVGLAIKGLKWKTDLNGA